jgi:acyl-coenzyme A synthetase/AMP-(fatty) acid ligase
VVAAGSAMPRQFIEWYGRRYGVEFRLAWGMTETTPIATVTVAKPGHASLAEDQKYDLLARHGRVSA